MTADISQGESTVQVPGRRSVILALLVAAVQTAALAVAAAFTGSAAMKTQTVARPVAVTDLLVNLQGVGTLHRGDGRPRPRGLRGRSSDLSSPAHAGRRDNA